MVVAISLLLLLVAAAVVTAVLRWRSQRRRLEREVSSDRQVRHYIVWLPPRSQKTPTPVVLAFHPGYATAAAFEQNIALHEAPRAHDFIIVYPEGHQRSWNAGTCCGPALRDKIDEKAFVHAILDDLETFAPIDRGRVYATGHSNGARLCYYLAGEMPDEIAAIAPIGGAAGAVVALKPGCRPRRPVPIFHLHGLLDQWAPYQGGQGRAPNVPSEAPVESGIAFWRDLAGARTEARRELFGGLADCTIYSGASDGTEVRLCRFANLGHHWPGTRLVGGYKRMAPLLGPTGAPVQLDEVNDAILEFVGRYRREPGSARRR